MYRGLFALAFVMLMLGSVAAQAKDWQVDYLRSTILFTGKQNDQEFKGRFAKFTADVNLDPKDPASGSIKATINIGSAFTHINDIDSYLLTGEWLDSPKFPKAEFTSTSISATEKHGCFAVIGNLTLKAITKEVRFPFCLEKDGEETHGSGQFTMSRTDYDVGTGQWAADDIVAHDVTVIIDIYAK